MVDDVALPTLIVVSGPPGSGKTTLAHEIARAAGCPAVSRDEIKEGMAHATPGFTPEVTAFAAGQVTGSAPCPAQP